MTQPLTDPTLIKIGIAVYVLLLALFVGLIGWTAIKHPPRKSTPSTAARKD